MPVLLLALPGIIVGLIMAVLCEAEVIRIAMYCVEFAVTLTRRVSVLPETYNAWALLPLVNAVTFVMLLPEPDIRLKPRFTVERNVELPIVEFPIK